MKIHNTQNNVSSFGMAWNKAARPMLAEAVATLSPAHQLKAVDIINQLEQNSPHHILSINSQYGFLKADSLNPAADFLSTEFFPGKRKIGFFSALKKFGKLIQEENIALPKKQPIYSSLMQALGFISKRNVLEHGVKMFDSMPEMFSRWSGEIAKSGRNVDSVISQIKRIDEFAKQNEIKIYIQNSQVTAYTKTQQSIFGFKNKAVELKHLDYIEKSLNRYVNIQKARATLREAIDEAKATFADKKLSANLASAEFVRKIRTTKPYQYLVSLKQKFSEKLSEQAAQKEKAQKAAAAKISEEIKI